MSLITAWHPISSAEWVIKSMFFAWNLRVVSCRNDMMRAIRGSYMLSETLLIINVHIRNVINHSITNGCLSLQHGIPFTMLIWFPKFWFCFKVESWFWQKWHAVDHKKLVCAIRSCSNHCYTSKKGYETLKQQWMTLHSMTHPITHAERMFQTWFVEWIWEFFSAEMIRCGS